MTVPEAGARRARALAASALLAGLAATGCDAGSTAAPGNPDGASLACTSAGCVQPTRCQAGQSESQFQRQTAPPSELAPRQRASVSVTFANCSNVDWHAGDGYALEPAADSAGPGWGVARLALPGNVPVGSEVTFVFDVTAPPTTGTYPFEWHVVPPSGLALETPSPAVSIDVRSSADCSVAGPEVRSSFEPLAPFVATGGHAHATLDLANCSTVAWRQADGMYLAALAGSSAAAFGAARVELPGDVPPGQRVAVDIELTGPATQGAYTLAWQMQRGTTALDTPTPDLALTALEAADCGGSGPPARFVRQSAPDSVAPDQSVAVSATMANCSDATWDASASLVAAPGVDGSVWGVSRVPLPFAVGTGFAVETPFTIHAPGASGSYPYRWSIATAAGPLDEPTPAHDVAVSCSQDCSEYERARQFAASHPTDNGRSWDGRCGALAWQFGDRSHGGQPTAIAAARNGLTGPLNGDASAAPIGAYHYWSWAADGHVGVDVMGGGRVVFMASSYIDVAFVRYLGTTSVASYNAHNRAARYLGWSMSYGGSHIPGAGGHACSGGSC